ncbi:MAG: hypothetical protein WCG47_15040, partial [Dermatophilaceae bacterium]
RGPPPGGPCLASRAFGRSAALVVQKGCCDDVRHFAAIDAAVTSTNVAEGPFVSVPHADPLRDEVKAPVACLSRRRMRFLERRRKVLLRVPVAVFGMGLRNWTEESWRRSRC